jgi:hypothetical protein
LRASSALARAGLIVVCLVLLTGCDLIERLKPSPLTLKITPRRADTRIEPVIWSDSILLNIHSDFGIDTAEIEFTSAERPTAVILRLHLKGLESFTFRYGQTQIKISLSSTAPTGMFRQSVLLDGREQPLTTASPYWMPAKVVWGNDKPQTIRYIEIVAPQDFLAGDYQRFSIAWIDFFRG